MDNLQIDPAYPFSDINLDRALSAIRGYKVKTKKKTENMEKYFKKIRCNNCMKLKPMNQLLYDNGLLAKSCKKCRGK